MYGWIAPGCLALGLVGCEDAVQPGELAITWRTAGMSCDDGTITRVRARLFDFESATPMAEGEAPCSDGTITLLDLAPESYSLVLEGFQGDCLTHGTRREDIDIGAGELVEVQNLPLDRRQRTIEVIWPFRDGGDCASHAVEQLEIIVVVRGTERRRVPSLCRPGRLVIPGIEPGALSLKLVGYDGNGTAVVQGDAAFVESAFDATCGADIAIEVPLQSCDGPSC